MIASCVQSVEKHYLKIEMVALSVVTAIFLSVGIFLLRYQTPMPQAYALGIYATSAGALTAALVAIKLMTWAPSRGA